MAETPKTVAHRGAQLHQAGLVEAVCVVREVRSDGAGGRTAIDKRAVLGPVKVTTSGLAGDQQIDTTRHGGADQAVYAYAAEDLQWWAHELGQTISPGQFGENLRVRGMNVTNAVIGEQWHLGGSSGVVLEVTSARRPCMTFQRWVNEPHWVKRFAQRGLPGAYFRVLQPGMLCRGDSIAVIHRPEHGVTVGKVFGSLTIDGAERLIQSELSLHHEVRSAAQRVLQRGRASSGAS
ncbi:MAG: MOSC domain-containing protein [Actinomycetota bacterium]